MQKLFIANRGEIAVRIIRTAKQLGLKSVLAVSEADAHSLGGRACRRDGRHRTGSRLGVLSQSGRRAHSRDRFGGGFVASGVRFPLGEC